MNFNDDIFGKDVTYDNIKIKIKKKKTTEPHSPSEKYIFGKNQEVNVKLNPQAF